MSATETMSAIDDSALAVMAEELTELGRVLTERGLMGSREFLDIRRASVEDFFIGVLTPDPAGRALDALVAFKPTRLYKELVTAAWRRAGEADAGIVQPDRFARLTAHGEEAGPSNAGCYCPRRHD